MSSKKVRSADAVAPAGGRLETLAESDWLLAMLRKAINEVAAGPGTAFPKANAVAHLASLYLKTREAQELARKTRDLAERATALELRAEALRAGTDVAPAASGTREVRHLSAGLSRSRTRPPRGLTRVVRHAVRRNDDRLPPPASDTSFPFNLAGELEIILPIESPPGSETD
jgi:hypothetical protein